MTCDVEEHSLQNNRIDDNVIPIVTAKGIPRLLSLFEKHSVKATFFVTGYFAERSPDIVLSIKQNGHEVGSHSFSHDPELALDKLSFLEQVREISKSKKILEKIVGEICSFRAPALRTNEHTIDALIYCGFTHDSSFAPGRFDGPLSSGFFQKLKWLNMRDNIQIIEPLRKKLVKGEIIEVPLTSLFLSYISNLSRVSPHVMDSLRPILFKRALKTNQHLLFLTHPNECIEMQGIPKTTRRSRNTIKYIFNDLIRHRLKLRNIGKSAIDLIEKEILFAKQYGYVFKKIREAKVE